MGRHVTTCAQSVEGQTVLPLEKFVWLAMHEERELDLCTECCKRLREIMTIYMVKRGALGIHRLSELEDD